ALPPLPPDAGALLQESRHLADSPTSRRLPRVRADEQADRRETARDTARRQPRCSIRPPEPAPLRPPLHARDQTRLSAARRTHGPLPDSSSRWQDRRSELPAAFLRAPPGPRDAAPCARMPKKSDATPTLKNIPRAQSGVW